MPMTTDFATELERAIERAYSVQELVALMRTHAPGQPTPTGTKQADDLAAAINPLVDALVDALASYRADAGE